MNYAQSRFGSAGIANLHELKQAGLLLGQGISFGRDMSNKHELRVPGDGSVALFGGAGSGKSSCAFANALIGGYVPGNFLYFLPREEEAWVHVLSLSLQGYALYFCNPMGKLGLPRHRLNPLDHLTLDSISLIADVQKTAMDICPTPSSIKSAWPYEDAKRWLADLLLYDAERNRCASLTGVFELLQSIQGNLDVWCGHLDAMLRSRFPSVQSFAGEIMSLQKEGREGFTAPMGVLQNTFSFMRDPRLQWTFSGSDVSTQWLTDPGRKIGIIVIWPIEYIQTQAPAIRQVIGSAIQHKLRAPGGASVSMLIDEAGQLKRFESVRELFTFGRGAGLVSNMVAWQEVSQIRAAFGAEANEIIGSAQVRVFKGVRTMESAEMVSKMAGTMTLAYDAAMEQSNAKRLRRHAAQSLLNGGNFFDSIADLQHYKAAEQHQTKQPRKILEPDEVLNLPPSIMAAFMTDLPAMMLGHWVPYFERSDFAGLYLNNPSFGEHVTLQTRWGKKQLRTIEEPVPGTLAHLPQYQDGTWRYVQGYRPEVGR